MPQFGMQTIYLNKFELHPSLQQFKVSSPQRLLRHLQLGQVRFNYKMLRIGIAQKNHHSTMCNKF